MISFARAPMLAVALMALLLAGCADEKPSTAEVEQQPNDALAVLAAQNEGPPTVEAPEWKIGDWWGHHIYFGPDDAEGIHINVIMVDQAGSNAVLATDDPTAAKEHAIFDFPILGEFGPGIEGTGFGGQWKIFDFPLSEGHTWRTQITIPDFNDFDDHVFDVEFTATYNPEISTLQGPKPGYEILGSTADGVLLLAHDYVPEIRWYANFVLYNFMTDDPEDVFFSGKSMGSGENWKGTYYVDEARELVQHLSMIYPSEADPTSPTVQPKPHSTFTVSDDATYIYGWIFSFAVGGAHETMLVDPAGNTHPYTAAGTPAGGEGDFWDEEALAGKWELVTAGAGIATGGGAFLWEVVETTGTL